MAQQQRLLTNVLRYEWNRFLSPIHPSKSDEPENTKPVVKIGRHPDTRQAITLVSGLHAEPVQHAPSSQIGITLEELRNELCHPSTFATDFVPLPRVERAVATCEVSVQTDAESLACTNAVEHILHEETYGGDLLNAVGCDLMKKSKWPEAMSVFKAALKNGKHADALYNLGLCYASPENSEQNMTKAFESWKQAAELKHPTALYQLAVCHLRGLAVTKAPSKGLALMNRAAHSGSLDAAWYLFVHSTKKGDFATAQELLKPLVCSEKHRNRLVQAAKSVGFPAKFKQTVLNSVYSKECQPIMTEPANTSTIVPCGISRRRLAFRPPKPVTVEVKPLEKDQRAAGDGGTPKTQSQTALFTPPKPPAPPPVPIKKTPKRLASTWTPEEQVVFFEGIKQHGKDFENIAKMMTKKKMSRNKEQIRTFFYNTLKHCKTKGCINDDVECQNVPRDAREIFLVANGCEWRKRTGGIDVHPARFRSLVYDGVTRTNVRVKGKKQSIVIKTPYCPCLLKYFPYDKRNAEIPIHVKLVLTPLLQKDRVYVTTCEQNPFLIVKVNINDTISSVLEFLSEKWVPPLERLCANEGGHQPQTTVRLLPAESIRIHKLHVEVSDDNSPLMSLGKLKKDYDAKPVNVMLPPKKGQDSGSSAANKQQKRNDFIVVPQSSLKEAFNIDEEKLRAGLTADNVGNASLLQLFYLCGMKEEIPLRYDVQVPPEPVEPWTTFSSLVARGYEEMVAKALTSATQPERAANATRTRKGSGNASQSPERKRKAVKRAIPSLPVDTTVDRENEDFLEQLNNLGNGSGKVTNRIGRPNFRGLRLPISYHNSHALPEAPSVSTAVRPYTFSKNVFIVASTSSAGCTPMPTDFSTMAPEPHSHSTPMKYFNPQPVSHATAASTSDHHYEAQEPYVTPNPHDGFEGLGDISFDSTAMEHSFLEISPTKTLPEDVRQFCDMIMQQNSVDYCRNFEGLIQTMESPQKSTSGL
ncbi:Myb-like DNA-binding domain containing protein [Aphelenchoides avenae]|nr:Myb-like DNA-binding domain containing protein [Aphelenchus avenae]